jgi:hypothetical protein
MVCLLALLLFRNISSSPEVHIYLCFLCSTFIYTKVSKFSDWPNALHISFTMKFSTMLSMAIASASICTALPTNLTNFLLVTTSQLNPSANTSELKAVSATSLFVRPPPLPPNIHIFPNSTILTPPRTPSTNPPFSSASQVPATAPSQTSR